MPTDNLKERIAEMREACTPPYDRFLETCTPESVLALIDEIERLERENAELKQHVADLNHDLDAAIKECNEQHR
jgi:cell division protein FtsB